MDNAAFKAENRFRGTAITFILYYGIIDILLCKLIFQFKCHDWQTIKKNTEIKCQQWILLRVVQLPCYAENVLCIKLRSRSISDVRSNIEHIKVKMLITDAFSQYLNNSVAL